MDIKDLYAVSAKDADFSKACFAPYAMGVDTGSNTKEQNLPLIAPRGSASAPIWVLIEEPISTDISAGYCFSGGMGHAFDKMLEEAKIDIHDVYIIARRPDTDEPRSYDSLENKIERYKPPLILTVGEACFYWLKECNSNWRFALGKHVGSLLRSDNLSFSHYMMPIFGMDRLMADWAERNITAYIDLGKVKDELDYYRVHGVLNPLRQRTLVCQELSTELIIDRLDSFTRCKAVASDIETVYPRRKSEFYRKHPGEPIVIAFAISSDFSLSFSIWRETEQERLDLWKAMQRVFDAVDIVIGQNFFNFDRLFLNMIGLYIPLYKIQDTLIRHHILWPELSHKLQFLTRQYTRQPFYKDEGRGWNRKDLTSLRHYNALDAAATFEVYEAQELEFKQRPQLR